jgi:hypothetical protein
MNSASGKCEVVVIGGSVAVEVPVSEYNSFNVSVSSFFSIYDRVVYTPWNACYEDCIQVDICLL